MKKTKQILALASSAVLLVTASVMGTMAYLQATTETVTNMFTVGNVSFDAGSALDEAKVDEYGDEIENADRVTTNQYKLIPGHEYTKDPTVHMAESSEACWLFVEVENDISAIEASENTIADQMAAKGWTSVADKNGKTNVYKYKDKVAGGADVVVFEKFILADNADVSGYVDAEITIKAYAVQADGFDSAQEAWDATYGVENN